VFTVYLRERVCVCVFERERERERELKELCGLCLTITVNMIHVKQGTDYVIDLMHTVPLTDTCLCNKLSLLFKMIRNKQLRILSANNTCKDSTNVNK